MTESIKGFGTYFFPPLFFEKEIDVYEARTTLLVDKTFYEFPFNNNKIFIHQSGFLSTDKDDRDISVEILNSIFLSTTLLKYRVRKTYPKERT